MARRRAVRGTSSSARGAWVPSPALQHDLPHQDRLRDDPADRVHFRLRLSLQRLASATAADPAWGLIMVRTLVTGLLLVSFASAHAKIWIVAKDGSGDFTEIQAAI